MMRIVTVVANWLLALLLAAGISTFVPQLFPSEMSGWQRLHVLLPVVSATGLLLLSDRRGVVSDRMIFFYLLAQVTVLCVIGILIKPPMRPLSEFLSLFVALPVGALLAAGGRALLRHRSRQAH